MTISKDLQNRIIRAIKSKKYQVNEMIDIFDISKKTFYKIKNNNSATKKSLSKKKSLGKKKPKINNSIKDYIAKYVIRNSNFNYKILIALIEKNFNVTISKSSIYKILSEKGFKKKKVDNKIFLINREDFYKKSTELKNKIDKVGIRNIISIDETSFDSNLCANKGWSKKGTKLTHINTTKKIRYSVISSISYSGINYNKIIKNSCNGDTFLMFIKELINRLPKDKYVGILLDNARIHHYKKLKEYINKNKYTELIYNVPYSPEYNPIERLFSEVKNIFRNTEGSNNLRNNINKSFNATKKSNIKNYYKKSKEILDTVHRSNYLRKNI